jgi:hypothetical protein
MKNCVIVAKPRYDNIDSNGPSAKSKQKWRQTLVRTECSINSHSKMVRPLDIQSTGCLITTSLLRILFTCVFF